MKKSGILFSIIFLVFISNFGFSQCDTIAKICDKNITEDYISDGQEYRAMLLSDELAEFQATFYGGSTYRIAACSGLTDSNLNFVVLDRERNVLYSNKEFENAPYWDLKFVSTVDCIIEASLSGDAASGFAVLLIGFKQKH
jgi:hypothetical protein